MRGSRFNGTDRTPGEFRGQQRSGPCWCRATARETLAPGLSPSGRPGFTLTDKESTNSSQESGV